MQAVILAAGTGSRLGTVSNGRPKCLLPIGGRPLIEHQLEALADAGIGEVLVVVGHKGDDVRKTVGNRAEFVENTRFEETNSLYSLWLAKDWVKGPFVLLNGDLLFHPDVLHRLLARGGNAIVFDSSSTRGSEQTKVAIREGKVIDLGKDLSPELTRGESLGLICFDAAGCEALFPRVNAMVQNGGEKSWVMEAIRSECTMLAFKAVNVAGLPWAEVDFPYDLNRAQREVWPAIHQSRWKKTLHWRRTKWIAASLGAMFLVYAGGFINSGLNSEKVEWTTIQPIEAKEVLLTLPKGNQQWWMASRERPLHATCKGPTRVRVEFRLLISSGDPKPGRYVVQVSLDGKPLIWQVFKSTPDLDASLPEAAVGDRDYLDFEIPGGNHVIDVSLLASTSDRLLSRVRFPEPVTPEEDEEN